MADNDFIDDVRTAKAWVNDHTDAFAALQQHLATVESSYVSRTGDYASLPLHRPPQVSAAIESAATEPGQALLGETRNAKSA